jgi:hypothetical protein
MAATDLADITRTLILRLKGAGQEDSADRPVMPVAGLVELLNTIPIRYRALLLLATFARRRGSSSRNSRRRSRGACCR